MVVVFRVIIVVIYGALSDEEKGAGRGRRMEGARRSIEGYDGAVGAAGAFAEGCCWAWGSVGAKSVVGGECAQDVERVMREEKRRRRRRTTDIVLFGVSSEDRKGFIGVGRNREG